MRITRFSQWTGSGCRRSAAVRGTSKNPARFLSAFLLTVVLADLPARAAITSFTFNTTGTTTNSINANGTVVNYKDDGSGQVTPFGGANVDNTGTLNLTSATTALANGTASFTFSNGDSFQATYSGVNYTVLTAGTNAGSAQGPATITGGTGAFSNASGSLTFSFSSTAAGSFTLTGSGSITTSQAVGSTPSVFANGTVNNASYATGTNPLAPGTIAAIFGTNLTDGTSCLHFQGCDQSLDPATNLLKTTLSGAQVTVNGAPVPIFYASPGQLGIQMPTDLIGTSATVQVSVNGNSSPAQTVAISPFAPGLFSINNQGTGQGAIQIANTKNFAAPPNSIPGSQTQPANPGVDFLTIYCTGLGQVSPPVPTGGLPGSSPPSTTVTTPQVTIGGAPATVSFSGLVPGNAGLYQVNVQVPDASQHGATVPVVLTIGGVRSNTVTVAVAGSGGGGGGGGNNPVVLQGTASSVTGALFGSQLFDSTATGSLTISATGASSGGQTVYSASGSGGGTVSCQNLTGSNTNSNWTSSLTATVTVNPDVSSLASGGGNVSGSFSFSLTTTGCGTSGTSSGNGTVTGTVNPGGGTTLILTTSGGG